MAESWRKAWVRGLKQVDAKDVWLDRNQITNYLNTSGFTQTLPGDTSGGALTLGQAPTRSFSGDWHALPFQLLPYIKSHQASN